VASSSDITLSLPRVIDLFEARRGTRSALLAEVSGVVRLGGPTERIRKRSVVFVQPVGVDGAPRGKEVAHILPAGRRIRCKTADVVRAGDPLTNGPVGAHDLLRILGPNAVRAYLLEEVQKVYRLQGVVIDDKHVEIIVTQMLGKVKVTDAGETDFLPGQVIDRVALVAANSALGAKKRPARCVNLLLGISKAAVQAESFLSAASFQETTRVLTQAALAGKVDELHGLKENVLLGHLVPAGTGFRPAVEPQGSA
jgi:DNA-directed RNA polymerase subunit beta'